MSIELKIGVIVMERHEELYSKYFVDLEEIMKELEEKEGAFKEEGNGNGLILKKIEKNVIDIFMKMLKISYDNVYVKTNTNTASKEQQFYSGYMAMFDKITTPWVQKAEKDKKFGRIEEYEKEQVKMRMAEDIKEQFKLKFREIYGE